MISMVKTAELYYKDAYLKEFEAEVLSSSLQEDGSFFTVLDRTAFFPEQGGQSPDVGGISSLDKKANVSYVSIADGIITHVTDKEFSVGEKVHGLIDWNHRFSNMQQHTGEHIFSGIVHSRFGYENVGFHLSDNEVTMDYSGPITKEEIADIERLVNRAVWENVEVICEFPDDDRLKDISYRSKKELSGAIRIVTIPGYDVCACCAPHVRSTSEVGFLKVVGLQNYKGGVRVSILCGQRAFEYVSAEHEIVSDLAGRFTTSPDKISDCVEKQKRELDEAKALLSEAVKKNIDNEILLMDKTGEDKYVVLDNSYAEHMRLYANKLSEAFKGYSAVFTGRDSTGYRFVATTGSDGKDISAIMELLKNNYGAKGGGGKVMIQGSMQNVKISDVIAACEKL